jgi:putative tricarboxylic transport membrane protein
MILGPLAEENFRRALSITQGDYSVFVTHPISAVLLAIALLIVVAPALMRLRQRRLVASS